MIRGKTSALRYQPSIYVCDRNCWSVCTRVLRGCLQRWGVAWDVPVPSLAASCGDRQLYFRQALIGICGVGDSWELMFWMLLVATAVKTWSKPATYVLKVPRPTVPIPTTQLSQFLLISRYSRMRGSLYDFRLNGLEWRGMFGSVILESVVLA